MEYFPVTLVFCFGAILASFIHVCALRTHTGRSLNTPSHCLSCGARIRWYHLVPVLSYILLRGRCAECGARIPVRYVLVEVVLGVVFVLVYLFGNAATFGELIGQLVIVCVLAFIFLYDSAHYIIPDEATALLAGATTAYILLHTNNVDLLPALQTAGTSALLAGGFFYALHALSGGRWLGFGDVKLVVPLALLFTPAGVFSFITLSFWIGAVYGVGLLSVRSMKRYVQCMRCAPAYGTRCQRWGTMRTEVPFAPFLIVAFILIFIFDANVFALTYIFIPV